jgi:hypothetical protein
MGLWRAKLIFQSYDKQAVVEQSFEDYCSARNFTNNHPNYILIAPWE